jgi:hypothetical protein
MPPAWAIPLVKASPKIPVPPVTIITLSVSEKLLSIIKVIITGLMVLLKADAKLVKIWHMEIKRPYFSTQTFTVAGFK